MIKLNCVMLLMSTECHQDNSLKIGKLYIEIKSKAIYKYLYITGYH